MLIYLRGTLTAYPKATMFSGSLAIVLDAHL